MYPMPSQLASSSMAVLVLAFLYIKVAKALVL